MDSLVRELQQWLQWLSGAASVHPKYKFPRQNDWSRHNPHQALVNGRQDSLTNSPRAPPRLPAMGAGWFHKAKSGADPRHEGVEPTGQTVGAS